MTGKSSKDLPVNKLKVPAGFKVEVLGRGHARGALDGAGRQGHACSSATRQLKRRLRGVAPRRQARGEGAAERPRLAERRRLQQGHALHRRARTASRATTASRPTSTTRREAKVVVDNLDPDKQPGHFWKFLAMGPDGKLYFNVGAPGNIVMPSYFAGDDHARRSRDRRDRDRRVAACATRSASTSIR